MRALMAYWSSCTGHGKGGGGYAILHGMRECKTQRTRRTTAGRAFIVLAAFVLARTLGACSLDPSGKTDCHGDGDCLEGSFCDTGTHTCVESPCDENCMTPCCGSVCCPDGLACDEGGRCVPMVIEPFERVTFSANPQLDGGQVISISDVGGVWGCWLSQNVLGMPGIEGHQVVVQIQNAATFGPQSACVEVTAIIGPGCRLSPASSTDCAQYQRMSNGYIERLTVRGGTVQVTRPGGDTCEYDVSLDFGEGRRFDARFSLQDGYVPPWCEQPG